MFFPELSRGAEAVERPRVLRFVMAQHVEIAVVGANAKVACFGGVPPAVQLVDLKLPPTQDEPEWPFVGAVPRVAFDAHFAHRASAEVKGARRREIRIPVQVYPALN